MYFGSVRFFKHLILTVILLLMVIPWVLYLHLSNENKDKDVEIRRLTTANSALLTLSSYYDGDKELGTEDIYQILVDLGIDNQELVELIFEKDRAAFDKVMSVASNAGIYSDEPNVTAPVSEEPVNTTAPPETVLPETTQPDSPYSDLYPHLYSDALIDGIYENDDGSVYLTFDDGPSIYTNDVLNYLDKWNAEATFFVIPDESEECKAYLNRMLDSGHSIGIHTLSHKYDEIYQSVEAYLDDFNLAYNMIYEQTGYKPYLFRFPGGSKNDYNKGIAKELIDEMTRRGFVYYDWNVDSQDALGADWTTMYDSVISQVSTQSRPMILFHDGPSSRNMVYVLDDILSKLSQSGYRFAAIKENTKPIQF